MRNYKQPRLESRAITLESKGVLSGDWWWPVLLNHPSAGSTKNKNKAQLPHYYEAEVFVRRPVRNECFPSRNRALCVSRSLRRAGHPDRYFKKLLLVAEYT